MEQLTKKLKFLPVLATRIARRPDVRNAVEEFNSAIREITQGVRKMEVMASSLAKDFIYRELVAGISPSILTTIATPSNRPRNPQVH